MRRVLRFVLLLLGIGLAYFWFSSTGTNPSPGSARGGRGLNPTTSGDSPASSPASAPAGAMSGRPSDGPGVGTGSSLEADFPIAAPLNAPNSTIARDLDILSQLFEAWQSNFPGEGNPVGENAEITAALMGENRLELALISRTHRALNERGELCDRWGTPFRFHQLSGTQMEIRSAGPDRTFATADDALWTPQSAER